MRTTNLVLICTILVFAGFLALGCATARTHASISQTSPDGFTETVEFETDGIVTWGSKQDLQKGDLLYTWGEEGGSFGAGGEAVGQVSADPMTALTVDLLRTLIERAIPIPLPSEPDPTVFTPENVQRFLDFMERRENQP